MNTYVNNRIYRNIKNWKNEKNGTFLTETGYIIRCNQDKTDIKRRSVEKLTEMVCVNIFSTADFGIDRKSDSGKNGGNGSGS